MRSRSVASDAATGSAPRFVPEPALRAQLERLAVVSVRPHGHLHTGGRRSRATGSSIEFADHRRYSPGDDFRRIDWNVYARSDSLFVKVREFEETLVVHLLLDTSGSMATGRPAKFQVAQAVLAALAWMALAGHDVLAGAAFGQSLGELFAPQSSRRQADRFFEYLARQQARGGTGLRAAAQAYGARALPHGVAVLVSDLLSPDATAAIGALAEQGHELTVVHVIDAEFLRPALADDVELVDIEGGGRLPVFADAELLRAYAESVNGWLQEMERFCHQRSVRYVPVESDWLVEDIVLRRLRQHGAVA